MAEHNQNIIWHEHAVTQADRAEQKNQQPCIIWFTGLSGSGKSTIAGVLEQALFARGHHLYLLDGDNVRHGLNKDLSFSDKDRVENIRRIGEVAKLFVAAGLIVTTAFISPFRAERDMVRELVGDGQFVEVFVDTPLDVCEERDPKGLYKKARAGEIPFFTGIASPYEAPEKPEVVLKTAGKSVEAVVEELIDYLQAKQYIR